MESVLWKQVFFKMLQHLQENICVKSQGDYGTDVFL